MKLQTKIHKGMLLLIAVTLLISYSIFTYIIYRQTMNMSIYEVHQEAQYIKRLLANTGSVFLPTIDAVLYDTRISLIDKAGNVLYDSNRDIDFENHLLRSEVQEALAGKIGEDIRTSETLGTKMYYYAEMVDNNILRIAKKFDAMWITALRILPVILAAACIMFILAYILAKILVNKIIVPVNQINLSNPLERKNYDEIMPLLVSIEKQNMEKEKIDTIRKEFSANVSHELKTPLHAISGYAELLNHNMVDSKDVGHFAGEIYSEAQRMVQLVEDIISLSHLDEGAEDLQKEETDLYALAHEVLHSLQPQALRQGVTLELEGAPAVVNGIPQLLHGILYNLVDNAVKYNHADGTAVVTISENEKFVTLSVRDTGIGIDTEHQERIFERFYRVDKSRSREVGGTGLGLSIVKHAAKIHHAQIKLQSVPGEGTVISVSFEK